MAPPVASGIIDEHIDPSFLFKYLFDAHFYSIYIGDVHYHHLHAAMFASYGMYILCFLCKIRRCISELLEFW
jgi:hypothetical protein